jgi:hypothetical protein
VQQPEIIAALCGALGRRAATAVRLYHRQIDASSALESDQRRRERAKTDLQDADRPAVHIRMQDPLVGCMTTTKRTSRPAGRHNRSQTR